MKERQAEAAANAWRHQLELVKSKANLAKGQMENRNLTRDHFEYWAERYSNNMRIFNMLLNHRPQGV